MVLGIASSTYRYLHQVQDGAAIFAISLIPVVGIIWGLFRQHDLSVQAATCSNAADLFNLVESKNRIKKICALGGLIQTIAYVALIVLNRSSLLSALTQSAFPLLTLSFSAAFYLTAKLNESRMKSPQDLMLPNTKFW